MKKLPTWVEVDLDILARNLRAVKSRLTAGSRVLLTIKADAYGHGAVQVARATERLVDMFGVATVDEALELGRAGINGKILILSPVLEKEISQVVEGGFATTVPSLDFAGRLSEAAVKRHRRVEVHVEIDTGMGRTGLWPDEAVDVIAKAAALPGLRLGGVFTHFPVSDTDPKFTREQVRAFELLVDRLAARGIDVPLVHSANSAAVCDIPESHMQMVRPGLLVYGHVPSGVSSPIPVEPVMSWKSRLVQVRKVRKGATISYGRTFSTARETTMGVVPVGYGHGYPYRLSNSGRMLVAGQRVSIIGRVTMDMTMIDLTDVTPVPSVGDEVVLFGRQSQSTILVEEIAEWAGSIPYEILCGISKRVTRAYIRDGKVESYKSLLGEIPTQAVV